MFAYRLEPRGTACKIGSSVSLMRKSFKSGFRAMPVMSCADLEWTSKLYIEPDPPADVAENPVGGKYRLEGVRLTTLYGIEPIAAGRVPSGQVGAQPGLNLSIIVSK